jgi:pantetheine-phosphate adenylyltransferase
VRRYRLAVLGGTFDHLHAGHLALLASAFRAGRQVAVGVTTDRFLARHPKPFGERPQPYATRRRALVRWLRRTYPARRWRVSPLENPFGRSLDPEVKVLVVSAETESGGRAVNRERRRLGRAPVPLLVVPLVLADDLEPVSSRRIRAKVIAPDGKRLAPLRVALRVGDRRDRAPTERAVRRVFPRARVAASRSADLRITVTRRPAGGWKAVERSSRLALRPRRIRGNRPADLERGLLTLLRPRA